MALAFGSLKQAISLRKPRQQADPPRIADQATN
jgi:hypothetical protein